MDIPETEEQKSANFYISLHFIYGFLALLGICILFSLAKAIYHFYKRKSELNDEMTVDSTTIESHSVSNESPVSERQPENNVSESDRLNVQLDKLRKLLNRLNAMGTFSRDTIGDLSAQSAGNLNLREASSDMSAFWSSIDYDEFEESVINESNHQKTLTEKSISVSDFSLDTSGMHFNNLGHNRMPVPSNECVRNAPALNSKNNPSEAIAQILTILDSIMLKSRLDAQSSAKLEIPNERNSREFVINKNVCQPAHSVHIKPSKSQSLDSSSSVSIDKTLSSTSGSVYSDTLITTPESEEFEILKNETLINNELSHYIKKLDHSSQAIETKNGTDPLFPVERKISKGTSVVNIPSSETRDFKRLSISSKSIDARKLTLSQSVAICIDPNVGQPKKATNFSESTVHSGVSYLKKKEVYKNISVSGFRRKHCCTLEVLNRSHSLSTLLAKKLPLQSIQPYFIKSCCNVKEYEGNIPPFKTNTEIMPKKFEFPQGLKKQIHRKIEEIDTKNVVFKAVNYRKNPRSFRSLNSAIGTGGSLKLSISESEIKQSPFLESFSPNLTPSNSETFLTPVIAESTSSRDNIDWKSPIEPISEAFLSQNQTPHNENAVPPKTLRIFTTPPSPK